MNISEIRKRLQISEKMEAAFNDGEPNWYAKDIKTLLALIDRMNPFIENVVNVTESDREEAISILKELEQ